MLEADGLRPRTARRLGVGVGEVAGALAGEARLEGMVRRPPDLAGEALAARPGYSEHQTGLAADVSASGQGCVIQVCFAKTKAGKWLAANAWQYGFILRYPDGQTKTTGYQFEPWHFRYVGVQLATEMKSQNITVLEKFWNLPAAPAYTY
jgi:D-alanyl-D-alanine carboxypeptidase